MPGYLLTAKKNNRHSIVHSYQFKMLLVSLSFGVMAGLFIALVRLKLGLPGHKALFWMTPVLMVRLLGRCRIGATAGALSAALTTYALGSNLAGGVIGMPLIAFAGIILDWTVHCLEKNRISGWAKILVLGLAGIVANVICLGKRVMLPTGFNPHFLFCLSGIWFRFLSYAFFGLMSAIVAAIIAHWMVKCYVTKR